MHYTLYLPLQGIKQDQACSHTAFRHIAGTITLCVRHIPMPYGFSAPPTPQLPLCAPYPWHVERERGANVRADYV